MFKEDRLHFGIGFCLILILLVCSCIRVATVDPVKLDVAEGRSDSLQLHRRLSDLEYRISRQENYLERSDELVTKGFNSTNIILVSLTVFVAFIGIYVSWFIGKAEKKIVKIEQVVTEKEETTKQLVNDIKNNIDTVFDQARRYDTVALLDRLTKVPLDIANLVRILLARDFEQEDFAKLRQAYSELLATGSQDEESGIGVKTYKDLYLMVLFQHFIGQSLSDELIQDNMVSSLDENIQASFRNDIDKVTKDIALFLSNKNRDFNNRERILVEYRLALEQSKYNKEATILESLKSGLNDDSLWNAADYKILQHKNGE